MKTNRTLAILSLALCFGLWACSEPVENNNGQPATGGSTGDGGSAGDSSVGGSSSSSGTGGSGGEAAGGGSAVGCDALQDGMNTGFMVDGEARTFILNFPNTIETGGPWPVIFNWHGLGDSAPNMNNLIKGLENDPNYPFIGVTPEDTNYSFMGLVPADWDTLKVDAASAATNKEARLFDEILACLDTRFGVDPDRVHSMGFSLGSIVTDMLGVIRGQKIASLATYSGAYLSNETNKSTFPAFADVGWPAPTHGNAYAQMLIHGGVNDNYPIGGVVTLHFDQFAENDRAYLNGMGHDAILCAHGDGHTAPSGIAPKQLMQFFKDHPRGTKDSPYANGLPGNFYAGCTYHDGS